MVLWLLNSIRKRHMIGLSGRFCFKLWLSLVFCPSFVSFKLLLNGHIDGGVKL